MSNSSSSYLSGFIIGALAIYLIMRPGSPTVPTSVMDDLELQLELSNKRSDSLQSVIDSLIEEASLSSSRADSAAQTLFLLDDDYSKKRDQIHADGGVPADTLKSIILWTNKH